MKLNTTLIGHSNLITEFVLIDEFKLASSSIDNTIIVWDLVNLVKIKTLVAHTSSVNTLLLTSNTLISGSTDSTIRLWDINNNFTLLMNISTCGGCIVSALGSLSENCILSGSLSVNNGVSKWNVFTGSYSYAPNTQMMTGSILIFKSNPDSSKILLSF